jgi:hypothetical protein
MLWIHKAVGCHTALFTQTTCDYMALLLWESPTWQCCFERPGRLCCDQFGARQRPRPARWQGEGSGRLGPHWTMDLASSLVRRGWLQLTPVRSCRSHARVSQQQRHRAQCGLHCAQPVSDFRTCSVRKISNY